MTQILICSDPNTLGCALSTVANTATVEAEFGDVLVSGTVATLAHHGPRANNPAPCLERNKSLALDAIGLSHFDLDAIGGTLALLGQKPGPDSFWALAAFMDVNGAHKLGLANASPEDVARLYAWWAWNEEHKVFPPRDGSTLDVSDKLEEAKAALALILSDNVDMLAKGEDFRKAGEKLNADSFVEASGGVILRVAPGFTNHLYTSPAGEVCKAVVAFNTLQGSVTVSFAEAGEASARDIVQALWGPLAGGHKGIAGSPRGQRMTLADLAECFRKVVA